GNEEEIDRLIAEWVARHDLDTAERVLLEADVVASRVYTVEDIFRDPHFRARDMLVEAPDDELGEVALPGVVPKLSGTPGAIRHAGGANGRDTVEVLLEHTTLTEARIRELCSQGVLRQSGY